MQLEKLGQSSGIQEVAVSIVLVGLRDFYDKLDCNT